MKYMVVVYMDSQPMGSKKFDTREEAEQEAHNLRYEDFWESVAVYEVEK